MLLDEQTDTKEGRFETLTSSIDRARRSLSRVINVGVGASRPANPWVKYWILGVFVTVIWTFGAQGRVWLKHRRVQSIELVEFYWEAVRPELEPVHSRIQGENTQILY